MKTHVLGYIYNKVLSLNIIKGRFQHRCFPMNFCEIFNNTYLVEYLQQLLLAIAAWAFRERFNVQYFHFGGICKATWISNKLLLHFLHKVRQLEVINLTYLFITLWVYSALFATQYFSVLWKYILPKIFFQRNFLVLQHICVLSRFSNFSNLLVSLR